MVAKKMTIEGLAKTINGLSKTVEDLAIITQRGFEGVDGKFKGLKSELIDFKQETRGNFALVRQETTDFKREMKSEFGALKLSLKEDIEKVAQMGREDMDAFGQDILKIKKNQVHLESLIKPSLKSKH
ncbi:MAG: hypothetical protein NTY66_01025 [Candidatus Vogelbacteria bacterium]|nr:hypothetical protein [Candidatus Vogelbacteria bacterium]